MASFIGVSQARSDDGDQLGWYSASMGYSSLSYTQTGIHLDETAVAGKLSYGLSTRRLDLALNGFGTLFPLFKSGSTDTLRIFGLNARAGPNFKLRGGWFLHMSGGYYYTTTVSKGVLGYQNEGGPELFEALDRPVGEQSLVQLTAKQVYVWSGVGGIMHNYEFGLGGSYIYKTVKGRRWSVSADWTNLRARTVDQQITSISSTVSVGYGW